MTIHLTSHASPSVSAETDPLTPTSVARLPLKLKDYFHPDSGDIDYFAWAAERLHLGMRIENMADEDGFTCVEVTLYDAVPKVECRDAAQWWPLPRGWQPGECRLLLDDERSDWTGDTRWETHQSRACMLRVSHKDGCCERGRRRSIVRDEWFVGFSRLQLTSDLDYNSFPHDEVSSSGRVLS